MDHRVLMAGAICHLVEEKFQIFRCNITDAIDKFLLFKTVRVRDTDEPWITPIIKSEVD